MDLADLQRTVFDGLYTYRIQVAIQTGLVALVVAVIAWRAGWFAAARRHPARSGALLVLALAVAIPAGWYVASPLWIRTVLVEPDPVAVAQPTPTAAAPPASPTPSSPAPAADPTAAASPASPPPAAFAPRRVASGSFRGTDEFHFGRGTAAIVETEPGRYRLRLDDFSVRNGPDLFVYLSPVADDYADGALELGRLKATDGAFGYDLPPGTDPAAFASALIWCKQFSHLFAVAELAAT